MSLNQIPKKYRERELPRFRSVANSGEYVFACAFKPSAKTAGELINHWIVIGATWWGFMDYANFRADYRPSNALSREALSAYEKARKSHELCDN